MLSNFQLFEHRFHGLTPFLERFLTARAETQPRNPDLPSEGVRPRIGLALSSGASKGLAHIGVIQVLEEHGVAIDTIAGTSMGAYVGACWAGGMDGKELERLAAEIETPWSRLHLVDPVFPPRRGFMKGERIKARLSRAIGNPRFSELQRRLLVIATELETFEATIFRTGNVCDAVHASLAIPGICWPVEINGLKYIDGGVSDPLPVRALFDAGMDVVIAVSVIPTVDELRNCQAKSEMPGGSFHKIGAFFNKHFNYFAPGNILDILRSSALGGQIRVAEFNGALADVYLRPIVCTGSWHDYHNFSHYIRAGREAALDSIEALKALSQPLHSEPDPHHLPSLIP